MKVYYDDAYAGAAYAFETTRKAQWVAHSLAREPIDGVALTAPAHLGWDAVCSVHDPIYVQSIRSGEPRELAQSQGFTWDPGLGPMVLASNGGVVAASLDALRHGVSGSLSSGLHHARRDQGAGYCTFNGLALAAQRALGAGARSVLILDLDAHAGGGTAQWVAGEPRVRQFDVSVDPYDSYLPGANLRLEMVTDAQDYLPRIASGLRDLEQQHPRFDLCLYNAGMDPYEGCPDGGLAGITHAMLAARERMVFEWCARQGLPVAFTLAGGYIGERLTQAALVALHRLTLSEAARSRPA